MVRNPTSPLLRIAAALTLAGALACGTDPGLHAPGTPADTTGAPAATTPATPPAPLPPATPPAPPEPPAPPRVAVSQFVCIGMVAPAQVRQRINGGLTASGELVDVSFVKASNSLMLVTGAEPQLDPAYDGGYWKQTYGFDAWRVGTTDVAAYTLLFPPGPYPFRFQAMAMADYLDGGSYQDELTCGIL